MWGDKPHESRQNAEEGLVQASNSHKIGDRLSNKRSSVYYNATRKGLFLFFSLETVSFRPGLHKIYEKNAFFIRNGGLENV